MTDENRKNIPLAERMRPQTLDDFVGQEEVVGKGKILRQAIENDALPSMIFWGPPSSGKTTLARIVASHTQAEFIQMSAVTSGVKDLREVIRKAKENKMFSKKTILFVDEIHRWSKTQQDALLPHVENGTIVLIGATTENPSFEVRPALLSRCRVFVLKSSTPEQIVSLLKKALADQENGLGDKDIKISDDTLSTLAQMSNGDIRTAYNVLEFLANYPLDKGGQGGLDNAKGQGGLDSDGQAITKDHLQEAFQKSYLMYDKDGEEHYNIISALHKSMRGSDPDAALYWLCRMLEGGEDPIYLARRIVRFASEDIGLANSKALEQAVAAFHACHFIGMPECGVILAQAVVYMAKCPKSNELYMAYNQAMQDVRELGNQPVPLHIRNAPTKLMKDLGYGAGYKYSPDHGYNEKQEYLPDKLKGRKYIK